MWHPFRNWAKRGSGISADDFTRYSLWNVPSHLGDAHVPTSPYQDKRSPIERIERLEAQLRARSAVTVVTVGRHTLHIRGIVESINVYDDQPVKPQKKCTCPNRYRVSSVMWRCVDCGEESI